MINSCFATFCTTDKVTEAHLQTTANDGSDHDPTKDMSVSAYTSSWLYSVPFDDSTYETPAFGTYNKTTNDILNRVYEEPSVSTNMPTKPILNPIKVDDTSYLTPDSRLTSNSSSLKEQLQTPLKPADISKPDLQSKNVKSGTERVPKLSTDIYQETAKHKGSKLTDPCNNVMRPNKTNGINNLVTNTTILTKNKRTMDRSREAIETETSSQNAIYFIPDPSNPDNLLGPMTQDDLDLFQESRQKLDDIIDEVIFDPATGLYYMLQNKCHTPKIAALLAIYHSLTGTTYCYDDKLQ